MLGTLKAILGPLVSHVLRRELVLRQVLERNVVSVCWYSIDHLWWFGRSWSHRFRRDWSWWSDWLRLRFWWFRSLLDLISSLLNLDLILAVEADHIRHVIARVDTLPVREAERVFSEDSRNNLAAIVELNLCSDRCIGKPLELFNVDEAVSVKEVFLEHLLSLSFPLVRCGVLNDRGSWWQRRSL